MASVVIREFRNTVRTRDANHSLEAVQRILVSDVEGRSVTVLNAPAGVPTDTLPLSPATLFVEIECASAVRYAVRPKNAATTVPATANHNFVPANTPTLVGVYGGAVINFLA